VLVSGKGKDFQAGIPSTEETFAFLGTCQGTNVLAALFAPHPDCLSALDLFNEGFYREAHEAWNRFWPERGRTTAWARCVEGSSIMAVACVKIHGHRAGHRTDIDATLSHPD